MPQRNHHNDWPADAQSPAEQDWQRLVEQRLPTDLEVQARRLKAFQRARGLPSALVLLRGLLYYVLSHTSLRDLSAWSRLIGLTSKVISGQAWHQRRLSSADWLLWLFNALLAAPTRSFGERLGCSWSMPPMSLAETSGRTPGACTVPTTCSWGGWPGCASAPSRWVKALLICSCRRAISWWATEPIVAPSNCWLPPPPTPST
jgi:hypothetical protein